MAPLHTASSDDRKRSSGSISSSSMSSRYPDYGTSSTNGNGERRPSAGSGHHVALTGTPPFPPHPTSEEQQQPQQHQQFWQRSRHNSNNGRSHYFHPLDPVAQAPLSGPNPNANTDGSINSNSSSRRKNNSKDGSDSGGFRYFFRSTSRPPSPSLAAADPLDPFHFPSGPHTRKTSAGSYRSTNTMNQSNSAITASSTTLHSSNTTLHSNSSSTYFHSNNGSRHGSSSNLSSSFGSGQQSYQHRPTPHPFSPDSSRRRSTEYYSRSPSPDQFQPQQQQQNAMSGKHQFPTTPPFHNRSHQRAESLKSASEAPHRRTKSTDFGDMNSKRPGLPQELADLQASVASPAKEAKKTIFSIFKKKPQGSTLPSPNPPMSSSSHDYNSRKYSADDSPLMLSPPSLLSVQSLSTLTDQDSASTQGYSLDRRHGSDGGDSQRHLPPFSLGKKNSKKDIISHDPVLPGFVVDQGDVMGLTGIKDDPKNGQWLPPSPASGADWHAPESWGVRSIAASIGPLQKSLTSTSEDVTSDEVEYSDYESWNYDQKKRSAVRIFRPDTTYTTVNCECNIKASDLSAMLARKIFKPDTSKYHLYIERNNIVRPLSPNERPQYILRRCLLEFGYTDQDKLDELSGKDNSFLCRFTFAENVVPHITEADFSTHAIYTDVNLERLCLPTIPIFLYSRAKDIRHLNISHNQRMDLPLDFIQNCTALKELRMAYNDLVKIPSNVRYIVNLQLLDARGNRIRDLEKAHLDQANKLHTLILQCNRLDSIPSSFEAFQNLRTINLSSNNFKKFPDILCSVVSLEELDLSFNDIGGIPVDISNLVRLKKLLLYGNKIMPYLPKSMESLVSLRKLDIRQNGLLNLDVLNDLPALEELLVDYNTNVILNNTFRALVRASIVKCNMADVNLRGTGDTLVFLDLSSNKLSNLVPGFFEHLRCLETLKLDNNSISSIPSTISMLKRLRTLSVANNSLSSLPDEIAQLDSLIELDVHSNSIGELPASIWKCSLNSLNATSNLLESFPDPPESDTPQSVPANGVPNSSSSMTTLCDIDPQTGAQLTSKPLPTPPSITSNTTSSNLANTLETLCLGDNHLPDDVFYALSHFVSLKILNLSHNAITEIPRGQIPNQSHLLELYLSGNQLTSLPADDIERLRSLLVLHIGGNKLTTLPAELGKINHLKVLDVGCNMLKYNISNWPYDWNWNWNLELKYLNMSGNKRLQIKRQTVESLPVATRPGNLSEFGNLTCLKVLGLMDVTITDNVPDDNVDKRVRTSTSTLHNMSYGMADTLGDGENLCIWDLVHEKFQTKDDEVLFGLFDGRPGQSPSSCQLTNRLKDRFADCFKIELEKLEGQDTVVSALRRTFLGLDRELWPLVQSEGGKGGSSALVAYIKGSTLYSANVGDTIAVLVKKSDSYQAISQKHIPWNPMEVSRIKRSGGFVSENGLLNDELDISRSFGQYHLVPIVNSNPYILTTTLTEDDDFLIMASRSFWDVMSYATAVDIAKAGMRIYGDLMYTSQKLRDIAISYGARDHMVVMLVGVGDLFKKKEPLDVAGYHQHKKRPKPTEGPIDALKYLKPEIEPPQGDVAMVFTDIKNSTRLWEDIPIAMAVAIKEHFTIMRRQLRSIGGYEVKNEGDAMMASFSSVPAAILWCFKVQELLVTADWPQDILDSDDGKPVYDPNDSSRLIYNGLSVRMGIHWGQPVSHKDEVTRRMDYYGSMVNRAARICASADGGEICVSSDVIKVMQQIVEDINFENSDSQDVEHVREMKKLGYWVKDIGEKKLKGLETPESLHLLSTRLLAGRFAVDSKSVAGTPILEAHEQVVQQRMVLDSASVRTLQTICLRLERLVSGAAARHGRATEQNLALLSLTIQDNADQDDLQRIAENCIARIENCFSQLYMAKSGPFVEVLASLNKVLDNDPNYIMRALQTYVSIMGGMGSPALL